MSTLKVTIGILLTGLITFLILLNMTTNELLEHRIQQLENTEQSYEHTLDLLHYDHDLTISAKNAEIARLNLALDTAFRDSRVLKTLLNEDMKNWTSESVLGMRDILTSLPYGSWFEKGHYVTGAFGSMALAGTRWGKDGHKGVDIKPLTGNNYEIILSAIDGKVVNWGRNDRLFGNYLVIESLDGKFQIKLAHLSSIAIFSVDGKYDLYEGMEFTAGTRIARMGNTGNSTGHHLHIEYYIQEEGNWRLLNASAILEYIGEGGIIE